MCIKREPDEVYRDLSDLITELSQYESSDFIAESRWAGASLYFGLLENA